MTIPKFARDALAHYDWRQAMLDELSALHNNGIWELVPLPFGKSVIGCKWVLLLKLDLMVYCILGLAHIFFIINTTPMCIFYTREINLKPYFLYIQQT